MATLNMASIQVLVAKDATGKLKAAAKQRADEVFADAVIGMQVEFEDHPVTVEIGGGVFSPNVSRTLGGKAKKTKNLFSFIGFPLSSDPLEPIRKALIPSDPLGPKMVYKGKDRAGNNARFTWTVSAPNKQGIYKATPMPWADGWSWAQKVETKIPYFSKFLAAYMPDAHPTVSRSTGGKQMKVALSGQSDSDYTAPVNGYLTGIFANFIVQIKGYAKGGLRKRFGQ